MNTHPLPNKRSNYGLITTSQAPLCAQTSLIRSSQGCQIGTMGRGQ